MDNESWLCFACRRVVRRPAGHAGTVSCADCGGACRRVGDRVPVPPRDNERGWEALREVLDELDAGERGSRT